jgi:hypothetical protein
MKNVDSLHPGMNELLLHHGLSVQGQEKYDLKTAADQRGEQTINKDAKTTGIKFISNTSCHQRCENDTSRL